MGKVTTSQTSESRLMLQNPDAHIDHLVTKDNPEHVDNERELLSAQMSESRSISKETHIFLNETGAYSNPQHTNVTSDFSKMMFKAQRYSHSQIEIQANMLLKELWLKREQMWGWTPSDPTIVIDPAKGLELLGFSISYEEDLGSYYSDSGDVKIAGVINDETKSVHVSRQFPQSTLCFTAAHELGHAVLHDTSSSIHRDRALNGETLSREQIELEADKFATFFLMPAKLVQSRFIEIFGTKSFSLTEDTAFALSCSSLMKVRKKYKTLRHISRLLAGTKSYGGRNLYSLADQFRVSVGAMAIRLEELDLIERPAHRS